MPTKRRFVLFLIVLVVMLLIKYAVGQEAIGWDSQAIHPVDDIAQDAIGASVMGILFGVLSGWWRVSTQRSGDLVLLRIRA